MKRPRQADDDFSFPVKTALFFVLLPGRFGAAEFFPLRTCLYAPLWVLERSVSVYWALFRKLRGADIEPSGVPVPDRASERVASGE